MHDLTALKDANPLLRFLEQDGLVFRVVQSGVHTALCPFHDESTPSFRVWESDNHYHCYGCGQHGDLIDYLTLTRNLIKRDAIALLAEKTPHIHDLERRAPTPARPVEERVTHVLAPSRFAAWQQACEDLAANPAACEKLALWRGYSPATIHGAAKAHLLAHWRYWDQQREGLLVLAPAHSIAGYQAPEPADPETQRAAPAPDPYELLPIAVHCRLGPNTPGNNTAKNSWRYDPPGTKAWPFIWGNPIGARYLFVTEGQWDALAIADTCGWHTPELLPPGTCIIGLRGATSWRLWLDSATGLPLDPKATVIAIGDADNAGAKWYEPKGFLETLKPKVDRLITYLPTVTGCKDVNDLTKKGHLTGPTFLAWLRQRLERSKPLPKPAGTFLQWCRAAALREDEIGRASRLVLADPHKPKGRKSPVHWRTYWRSQRYDAIDWHFLTRILALWHERKPPDTGQAAAQTTAATGPEPNAVDSPHDEPAPDPAPDSATCTANAPRSLKPDRHPIASASDAMATPPHACGSRCPTTSATSPIPPTISSTPS